MNRIEAADPDAILAIYFFGLMLVLGAVTALVSHYKTKRWPQGHGATYWTSAKRCNHD